ncbi:MAG: OmpA family protein [Pseudomonadota bacterium]
MDIGNVKILAIGVALLFSSLAFSEDQSLRAALKGNVFDGAEEALQKANQVNASTLTPETYRRAGELFKRAQDLFDRGADVDRVRDVIDESEALFMQAVETAVTVRAFVSRAYEARSDALEAEAKERSPELWRQAEVQFYEAASRAEKGRERRVADYAEKAEKLYRDAELAAIENVLFARIDAEIEKAKSLDADDWAPKSYEGAVELLQKARAVLYGNRYDTDEPRNLARQALHQALHAQYVATLADDIDDKDNSLEAVLLHWEDTLRPLGDALDVPLYFDNGPDAALALILTSLGERDARFADVAAELASVRSRNRLMSQEILVLQSELENREAAQARLDRRLAEQSEQEALVARTESLFANNEAEVVRHENRLIIRLVGLGFASGSAALETRHGPLLEKLQTALGSFPGTPVTIEGHTDSYGADDTNLQLSVRRAQSVEEYLLNRDTLESANVSSVGFGETKPIANNETADGRWKNRRIDVVIYPAWWHEGS